MKQITFVILSLLSVLPLAAQYRVSGTIRDASGSSLPGASVLIRGSYHAMPADADGNFSFKNVKAGSYSLYVSFVGFEVQEKRLDVNGNAELDIVLKQRSHMADEVIISATRPNENMPVAFTSMEKEDIARRNMGQDVPYLLSLSPSLVTTSDAGAGVGYTSFRIRSTDQNRINITLNGIPLNDAESHGTWFVDLPDMAASIEEIQVQRGVGTSTNGAAAFGATVNFRSFGLRKEAYAGINSALGSFNTFKNSVLLGTGLINDKFSFDARFSKLDSDGYIDRAFSDLFSYSLAGTYYGKKDMFKLVHISGRERTYQAWYGVPWERLTSDTEGMQRYEDHWLFTPEETAHMMSSDPRTYNYYTYDNETDNYTQNHFQAFYSHESGNGLLYNLALHYTGGRGYYEQYKVDEDLADYGFEDIITGNDTVSNTDLVRQKWLDNHFFGFTSSITYKADKFSLVAGGGWNRYLGDHFGRVIWSEVSRPGDKNRRWYFNDAVKTDWNTYAKLNYYAGSSVNLYADMQLRRIKYSMAGPDDDLRDISQEHKHFFLNPKMGFKYRINGNNDASFSFAIANREPNRANYKDADPAGPLPVHETLYDLEMGYNYRAGMLLFGINAYNMFYRNQLVLTGEINDIGGAVMTNVPESYRRGIELSAGLIFTEKLSWEANATFSRNRIKDMTVYVDDWDTWGQREINPGETDISFSPSLIASGNLEFRPLPGMQLNLISKYVSKQHIDNMGKGDRMLDAYFLNDIMISYSIKPEFIKELSLQLMLNNVLSEEYESRAWIYRYYLGGGEYSMTGYFPQAGFNFMAGVSLKF